MRARAIEVALVAVALGCGPRDTPLPEAGPAPPATYRGSLDLPAAGGERSYRVHVPARPGPGPLPLLVALHGGLSSGETLMKRSRLRELADREGFLVAFPDGWGPIPLLRHWNAIHCCALGPRRQDDIGFLDALVDELSARLPVDRGRIFLVGNSNGGMLAYRYAALRSTRVAGVAAVASSIAGALRSEDPEERMPDLEVPVPLIVFHGSADPRVPYADVEPSLAFWVEQSGCASPPQRETRRAGRVKRLRWARCRDGAEVELFRLEGWGHAWPGPHFTDRLGDDDPLAGFDAAARMWEFFRRQRPRPDARGKPAS